MNPTVRLRTAESCPSVIEDTACPASRADLHELADRTAEALLNTDTGVPRIFFGHSMGAILAYEAANGVRFETIMSLNFANPFPFLLDRLGTRLVAIGADPFRAVPEPDAGSAPACGTPCGVRSRSRCRR